MPIWILEDNKDRIDVMRDCLRERHGVRTPAIYVTAPWFIEHIEPELSEAALISLDHDLEDIYSTSGKRFDPGTGRDAADFLAKHEPVCPVIIHSTNIPAAIGMEMVLNEAGWKTARITPYDDTEWITSIWIETVTKLIGEVSELTKAWPYGTVEAADEASAEIERRIREYEEGSENWLSWEEVKQEIWERLENDQREHEQLAN